MARVFSGVQPSGDLQLGNYIGALQYFVADQETHDCFYCVVDLHAITVPQDPEELRRRTYDVAALYLAVGLDPAKATLFVQSHVAEHAELAWILGCYGMFGELRRMTQFKDKSAKAQEGSVSLGLFAYPALMAADILLYDAERVPVGDDQRQHLELARDIAQRFNSRYGETFVVPQAAIPKHGARIMDLQTPENKMSKSSESPQGTLSLLDPPDLVRRKIKTAVTDSGREILARDDKPAISNLLTIFAAVSGRSIGELENEYQGKGYGDFKGDLAEAVVAFLEPIQKRYQEYTSDLAELSAILATGAHKAEAIARPKLDAVYAKVGFVPRVR